MNKKYIVITIIVLIMAIMGYAFYQNNNNLNSHYNIKGGILSGYTEEEIEEILNRDADKNSFSFEVNARPIFEDGNSEGNLRIANPPYSYYAIEVEIYLEENNQLIFKSGKISPNHYIEYSKLDEYLEKGEYEATAIIKAYDVDTDEYKGQSAAGLVITIKN